MPKPIDPSLHAALLQALSGSNSAAGQQPSALAPSPSGDVGAGSALVAPTPVVNAVRSQAGGMPLTHALRNGVPPTSDAGFSPEEAAKRQAIRKSYGYK